MADEELMDGGASALSFMTTEYVQGRTKRTVTAASALNELRSTLEAVASRVSGKKPKDEYEPRTRSRADKDTPEELTADVGDGTRIDVVQLIQELAVVVREIASAPSAAASQTGGSLGEAVPLAPSPVQDGPPSLPDPVTQPVAPTEIGQSRPNPTFGGHAAPSYEPAPVAPLLVASTANAPVAAPAMIGPSRDAFANATFGGHTFVSAAPVGGAGNSRAAVGGHARASVSGGVSQIKGPDRAAYSTAAQLGGMAPVYATGIQVMDAPVFPVVENIEPDVGDYRVIHLPEP